MAEAAAPVTGVFRRMLIAPIRMYQRYLSPALPASCRYYPTCSAYAVTAISVHGPVRGTWLAVKRLGRCHPFRDGGIDHVPPPRRSPRSVADAGDESPLSIVDDPGVGSAADPVERDDDTTDKVGAAGRSTAGTATGVAARSRSKTRGT